jgi:hypothetical protein
MELAKAYPHLRLKLQDLPGEIDRAKTHFWPKECPEAMKEGRVEFKSVDFLTEPPIAGCDVYYVCGIPIGRTILTFAAEKCPVSTTAVRNFLTYTTGTTGLTRRLHKS